MFIGSVAERPQTRAAAGAEEIGATQGHLHRHSPGASPESRRDVDHTRRPLTGHKSPPSLGPVHHDASVQPQHPPRPTPFSRFNPKLQWTKRHWVVSHLSPPSFRIFPSLLAIFSGVLHCPLVVIPLRCSILSSLSRCQVLLFHQRQQKKTIKNRMCPM